MTDPLGASSSPESRTAGTPSGTDGVPATSNSPDDPSTVTAPSDCPDIIDQPRAAKSLNSTSESPTLKEEHSVNPLLFGLERQSAFTSAVLLVAWALT